MSFTLETVDLKTFVDRVGRRASAAAGKIDELQRKHAELHIGALGDALSWDVETLMKESQILHLAQDVIDVSKDGFLTHDPKVMELSPEDQEKTLQSLAQKYIEMAFDTPRRSASSTSSGANMLHRMEGEAAREMMNMLVARGHRF